MELQVFCCRIFLLDNALTFWQKISKIDASEEQYQTFKNYLNEPC
ncbi:hypothetical protein SPONN_1768 [uncultured Candidatus Thioglobus sp.]|nr:hypothetical protein SPONN_1768 [uncultured Candidatus Thioglobus sp.]